MCPVYSVTHVPVSDRPKEHLIRQAACAAMQRATINSVGKFWPDRKAAGLQACCRLGETKVNNVANLKLEFPQGTSRKKSKSDQSLYSVPSCWTITGFRRVQTQDLGPTSASEQVTPANYVMSSSSQYQAEYQNMQNYVANLNIPSVVKADILLKIEEFIKNYEAYTNSLQMSHASLLHRATIQGAGAFNGRTIYQAHYEMTETCCPQEIRNAKNLRVLLQGWADGIVASSPR